MQKVTSKLPSWDTTKTQSKKGFDKVWAWADKLGKPVNRLSNRIGSEAFWPTTLDKESYKAARILRSFCKDGFYTEEELPADDQGPKRKQRVVKKIPEKVIQNAVGLAIFTTMRTGLWLSGAGGSGVLIARKEDGSWSPPSGIMLHTAGLGFLVGVDIYDCVLVINNPKALEAFTKVRCTLGGEVSAVAGPVGMGGVLENDGKWKQANRPVFTYLKSRGFYAGVQVDGTIVIERTDENERFYGERIGVANILAGKARHPPPEIKMLMETVKAAEGREDVDAQMMEELEQLPPPGDVKVDPPSDGKIFGIPDIDDPDPFGAHALEKEGLEIREAGTRSRPSSDQFVYHPSPTSPIFNTFYKRSLDGTRPASHEINRASHLRESEDGTVSPNSGVQVDGDATPRTMPAMNHIGTSNSKLAPGGALNGTERPRSTGADFKPVVYGNGVPPPLPPRSALPRVNSEFEDIDLERRETNATIEMASVLSQLEIQGDVVREEGDEGRAMSEEEMRGREMSKGSALDGDDADWTSRSSSEYHSPELKASTGEGKVRRMPGTLV